MVLCFASKYNEPGHRMDALVGYSLTMFEDEEIEGTEIVRNSRNLDPGFPETM